MKKKDMIPLYNEDFKLITGAMPIFNEDNPKQSHKAILKRIRETFKLNRRKLEEIHEERHQEQLEIASRMHASLGRWQTAYQTFKKTIVDMIKSGESVNNAIRATFNTTWFTPEAVRGRTNIWTAVKRDRELFNQIRRYAGWNKKIDTSLLSWDPENKMYVYHGSKNDVGIQKIQSPKKGRGKVILRVFRLDREDDANNEFVDYDYDSELWEIMKQGI